MSDLKISYEIFPPKNDNFDEKVENLLTELEVLKKFNPHLISVTYGAGGSNRENSLTVVKKIKEKFDFNVMPHFTCVCSNKAYINNYLSEIEKLRITDILALRGDEPKEIDVCYLDFKYAYELVAYIKERTNLNIAVAGYPEKHPRAKTIEDDILNLKKKVDMGAKSVYTQLFFDNSNFYKFIEECRKKNIEVPIIAGIMPIINYSQISKMAEMTGVFIPNALLDKLEKYKDNSEDTVKLGIEFATNQCADLIKNGVNGLHFYTLNKSRSVSKILLNVL